MKEQLKNIRAALGLSQQEMACRLNIPVRAYRNYEYVAKGFPPEMIQKLIEIFSVNANYLFTGCGEIFNSEYSKNRQIKDISSKLSMLQEKNNYSDKKTAELLGIYEFDYIQLKLGKRDFNLQILNNLKKTFDISIDWLLYET